MISSLSSETNSLSEPRPKSSETGNGIVYKPDPDIDIEEKYYNKPRVSQSESVS